MSRAFIAFAVGDKVRIKHGYPGYENDILEIVEVSRKIWLQGSVDKITYTTWAKGEGPTDGWTNDELELVEKSTIAGARA